jgi:hypothetical protein
MNHWGYVIEQLTRVDERAVELGRQHHQRSQRRTAARPASVTPDVVREPEGSALARPESERGEAAA